MTTVIFGAVLNVSTEVSRGHQASDEGDDETLDGLGASLDALAAPQLLKEALSCSLPVIHGGVFARWGEPTWIWSSWRPQKKVRRNQRSLHQS